MSLIDLYLKFEKIKVKISYKTLILHDSVQVVYYCLVAVNLVTIGLITYQSLERHQLCLFLMFLFPKLMLLISLTVN